MLAEESLPFCMLVGRLTFNLTQLKISPENHDGSLLTVEEFQHQRNHLQKEISLREEQIQREKQDDTTWILNCRDFLNLATHLSERFSKAAPEVKRDIIQNLGTLHLREGEITYELNEPYSILKDIRKHSEAKSNSLEPEFVAPESDKPLFFYQNRSVWSGILHRLWTYFRNADNRFSLPSL